MRTMTRHIINLCLACCALLAVSCSQSDDMPARIGQDDGKTLVLRIGTIDGTRASNPDIEGMHSLRVIILDNEDKVVHNFHTSFDKSLLEYTYLIKNLLPGKKTIYLIANEESVEYIKGETPTAQKNSLHNFLSEISIGTTGIGEWMDGLYFEPDYTKNIPLSARYDIEIGLDSEEIERTLYLVRVATKFTVNFVNYRDEPVKVKDFTISSTANQNYLMAKLTEKSSLFDGYPTWIDWLKYVSDESQKNPYDPGLADKLGWLQEYDLPESADRNITYRYNGDEDGGKHISVAKLESDRAGEALVENIYIPESKCLKDDNSQNGEQEYKMTFDIEGRSDNSQTYTLPNLKALFRNTHVWVSVRFTQKPVEGSNYLEVKVIPWTNGDNVTGGWEEVTE